MSRTQSRSPEVQPPRKKSAYRWRSQEQNVARALDPSLVPAGGKAGLDAEYVSTLGPGAVPMLVDALPHLAAPTRATVARGVERQRARLEWEEATRPWPAWNLEREQARAALATLPR